MEKCNLEEEKLLEGYRTLKAINPNGRYAIIDINMCCGFNFITGKKIVIKEEDAI